MKFPEYKKGFWEGIGPAVILIGIGIGSGELVLWPYLAANYGFGLMWGALLGITLQLVVILEIYRYTVVSGENIISGFARLWRGLPIWILLSTFVSFMWPAFAAISADLLVKAFSLPEAYLLPLSIFLLFISALVLISGGSAYKKMESVLKLNAILLFVLVLVLFVYYFNLSEFGDLVFGIVGIGEGYNFIPEGLPILVFFGALAYAGLGGNLLLGSSFYAIEEGQGVTASKGRGLPDESEESLMNFARLRKYQVLRNVSIFWGFGLFTMLVLSYISKVTLFGNPDLEDNFSFLAIESQVIGSDMGGFFGLAFLLLGVLALINTQIGVLDFTARTVKSSIETFTDRFGGDNKIYFYTILAQFVFGFVIFTLGLARPDSLILLSALFSALSMAVIAALLLFLNNRYLPKSYRPNLFISFILLFSAVLYFVLFVYSVIEKIFLS